MGELYLNLAEAHERLAKEYRALARCGNVQSAMPENEEKTEALAKPLTIEEVRAVMSAKADEGKTSQIKALLMKYDAGRLSGVDPKRYPELLRELEAM